MFFPTATAADWHDWRWQMRHRLKTPDDFARVFNLTDDESAALLQAKDRLPVALTPYYASLMSRDNVEDPLRRAHLPRLAEFVHSPGESSDPLGEAPDEKVPGIIHRYPDRVLFLLTNQCPVYCRYCMRARLVGKLDEASLIPISQWQGALDYIRAHTDIRDVLLSGGEPLMIGDERLDWLLRELRRIPHVEIIRFSTKTPLILPQRITVNLVKILKRANPVWLGLHILHAREFTTESIIALNRLADAGLVLSSQTPLLKGVNDSVETIKELMQRCVKHRVRPYYLFQCDPIAGSAHLRPSLETGLEIISALQGHTTGYAVPHYVVDVEGAGKMPLTQNYYLGRDPADPDWHLLRNYKGEAARYYDPVSAALYPDQHDVKISHA